MKKYLGLAVLMFFNLFLPAMGAAESDYTFNLSETEKKPYHFGGYVEFKPVLFGLNRDAAFYKLRYSSVRLIENSRVRKQILTDN